MIGGLALSVYILSAIKELTCNMLFQTPNSGIDIVSQEMNQIFMICGAYLVLLSQFSLGQLVVVLNFGP
jgi:ABC-type bacteriocin/lantibiotic exporter with double-glycine peptidase domain